MPYLNVDEVESALGMAVRPPNDQFAQLITLPHHTWDNRECHAIKVAFGNSSPRKGVYFIGGVHAREWGSSDILINFIRQVLRSYRTHGNIVLGKKTFTSAQVRNIVNTLDIFVFPQVNPDGRHYSMNAESMWRKNRRPAPASHPKYMGVDVNRNFDFLWDYKKYFHPKAAVVNSIDPHRSTYIGPSAASEPETSNVVWMIDRYPHICYFVDLHSYSEKILYNWGDDRNQTTDSSMNFANQSYNGTRGIRYDKTYKEYIPEKEGEIVVELATKMRDAIQAVRGRRYRVSQSFDLYPTAGTSMDYAFSRHLVDNKKKEVRSFTIEWGRAFQPPYGEMEKIIEEVTAGLLEFCLRAGDAPP